MSCIELFRSNTPKSLCCKEFSQLVPLSANLSQDSYQKVRDGIRALADNPRPAGCLKLTGREGWRIRIGVYRVIYAIDDSAKKVIILDIGHRKDIYR
ncbi:type II toxin-antitoxin system RelE/ParE family toxin [Microcystis sp. MC19]|uniref:type II toxin-antitoxin system RelE family toxin n=1 Tax=Microcystis sp. MC19 TaxID=1967666 RepID=UPI0020B11176|nr:type II toxin-antitoxin system RelE/ParE family toxin [Microcystis sp. MC19]